MHSYLPKENIIMLKYTRFTTHYGSINCEEIAN